jgi:cell division protein FtsN
MRRSYPAGKSSVFYIGKGIIISSLVITSLLSFVLGFFVGKSMRSPGTGQASLVTPLADKEEEKRGTEMKEVLVQQPRQTPAVQTAEPQKTPATLGILVEKNPREDPGIKKVQHPRETEHDEESRQLVEYEKLSKDGESKNSHATHEPAKIIYTVQIGAFRNASDADALKLKFVKKGYKSFIMASKRKDKILYKVMIGEFFRRKDAELLSVKIKKKEGLRTFVTLKRD